jgi:hypothetical protein
MNMNNVKLPIPIHEVAFLQAYLYEVFSFEGHCNQNFKRTEWHLKQSHSDEEIKSIIEFFKGRGLKCDCDILQKFDLREFSKAVVSYHSQKE